MKHVLVIMTDQQRADTIAAIGDPNMQTPHLDALARDSVVFDHCYTPSPVCVPARLSMMSGQYPARTGNNNNNLERCYEGEGYYAAVTKAGYDTCAVGKLHYLWDDYGSVGFKKRISQEELANDQDDYTAYIRENFPHVFDYHGMRSEMYYMPQISQLPHYAHPTQWIGDKSVEHIQNADPERPMFLMTSFIHPHPPYCPPAPWQKLYRDDPTGPLNPPELDGFKEIIGERCGCERLQMSPQDVLRMRNFYYACVSFVDYQVGRIIDALKEKGMYEDTLIVFTSDHGDMMGDYGAVGKRAMVDSSARIPMMIHYPGETPRRVEDPCSLVDLAPTILGYIGAQYDQNEYDGVDLFHGEKHDVVYSQHACGDSGVYMVTDGKRKLVYRKETQRYFYFDKLPEERNVYDPEDPQVQRLQKLLDAYRASDRNHAVGSKSYEPVTKTHPHYPGRMDQGLTRELEKATIPAEYTIDLN